MNEEQYLQNFLSKGQMLFRHVEEFRKIEDGNIRGDKKEGTQHEKINIRVAPNTSKISLGGIGGKKFYIDWDALKKAHPQLAITTTQLTSFTLDYVADIHLYCITYINSNTPNIDKVLNAICKLGKYSAVITNCAEFIEKVNKSIPNAKMGFVRYVEEEEIRSVFDKKTEYDYQNEFRIVKNANGRMNSMMEIGKLSGFVCTSESLHTLKQVL